MAVPAPLDPRLGVDISRVLVPESVSTNLEQIESLARAQRLQIRQSFDRHGDLHGPHRDQVEHYKALYELEEENLARYDHTHDSYSFCIHHVCALSDEAFKLGEPATGIATVFGVTSVPHTSRGLKVDINPEEEITQNDLRIAEKTAQQHIAPPRLQ